MKNQKNVKWYDKPIVVTWFIATIPPVGILGAILSKKMTSLEKAVNISIAVTLIAIYLYFLLIGV